MASILVVFFWIETTAHACATTAIPTLTVKLFSSHVNQSEAVPEHVKRMTSITINRNRYIVKNGNFAEKAEFVSVYPNLSLTYTEIACGEARKTVAKVDKYGSLTRIREKILVAFQKSNNLATNVAFPTNALCRTVFVDVTL